MPFRTRRFTYCLHCFKLKSPSWFDSHKTKETFDLSEETLAKHAFRFQQYVRDITSEMEMLNDAGKLFKAANGEAVIDPRLDLPESPIQPCFRPFEQFDDSDDSEYDDDYDDSDYDEEDYDDIYDDEDDDEELFDDDDLYEVTCPTCGDTICLNSAMIEDGSINCPNCNELLEFDLDDIEDEEESEETEE